MFAYSRIPSNFSPRSLVSLSLICWLCVANCFCGTLLPVSCCLKWQYLHCQTALNNLHASVTSNTISIISKNNHASSPSWSRIVLVLVRLKRNVSILASNASVATFIFALQCGLDWSPHEYVRCLLNNEISFKITLLIRFSSAWYAVQCFEVHREVLIKLTTFGDFSLFRRLDGG